MRTFRLTMVCVFLLVADTPAQEPATASRDASPRLLQGRVVEAETGIPILRVRVAMLAAGGNGADRSIPVVLTDDRGRFVLSHSREGAVSVQATKAGYARALRAGVAVDSGEALTLAMARAAVISGLVLDTAGVPVVAAQVTVQREAVGAGAAVQSSTSYADTDDLGQFRVGGLAAGRYSAVVTRVPVPPGAPSGPPATFSDPAVVELRAGDEVELPLQLQQSLTRDSCPAEPTEVWPEAAGTSEISGTVVGGEGPLHCALVQARGSGTMRRVRTDRLGRYTIQQLPAGAYTIEASMTGYVTLRYGQRAPAEPATPIRSGWTTGRTPTCSRGCPPRRSRSRWVNVKRRL